eukprot:TRINITY_DN5804_c0_g1_i2.p1 TRINITY_DN5804_c0_g1~~TRINITY_DN5804_c0_g1_i2.p1  ORF type:complete len:112 (-),score=11.08 TRINITY_DN5804_c0_g1_i2:45-380(-)
MINLPKNLPHSKPWIDSSPHERSRSLSTLLANAAALTAAPSSSSATRGVASGSATAAPEAPLVGAWSAMRLLVSDAFSGSGGKGISSTSNLTKSRARGWTTSFSVRNTTCL